MVESVVKAKTVPVTAEVRRCEMCSGLIGDKDHQEEDECGFWRKVEEMAIEANGGITVRA